MQRNHLLKNANRFILTSTPSLLLTIHSFALFTIHYFAFFWRSTSLHSLKIPFLCTRLWQMPCRFLTSNSHFYSNQITFTSVAMLLWPTHLGARRLVSLMIFSWKQVYRNEEKLNFQQCFCYPTCHISNCLLQLKNFTSADWSGLWISCTFIFLRNIPTNQKTCNTFCMMESENLNDLPESLRVCRQKTFMVLFSLLGLFFEISSVYISWLIHASRWKICTLYNKQNRLFALFGNYWNVPGNHSLHQVFPISSNDNPTCLDDKVLSKKC